MAENILDKVDLAVKQGKITPEEAQEYLQLTAKSAVGDGRATPEEASEFLNLANKHFQFSMNTSMPGQQSVETGPWEALGRGALQGLSSGFIPQDPAELKAAQETHPWLFGAADIGTGVARDVGITMATGGLATGPLAGVRAAQVASKLATGGGLLGTAARGAAIGAFESVGRKGEDESVIDAATSGAILGGAGAAAIKTAGKLLRSTRALVSHPLQEASKEVQESALTKPTGKFKEMLRGAGILSRPERTVKDTEAMIARYASVEGHYPVPDEFISRELAENLDQVNNYFKSKGERGLIEFTEDGMDIIVPGGTDKGIFRKFADKVQRQSGMPIKMSRDVPLNRVKKEIFEVEKALKTLPKEVDKNLSLQAVKPSSLAEAINSEGLDTISDTKTLQSLLSQLGIVKTKQGYVFKPSAGSIKTSSALKVSKDIIDFAENNIGSSQIKDELRRIGTSLGGIASETLKKSKIEGSELLTSRIEALPKLKSILPLLEHAETKARAFDIALKNSHPGMIQNLLQRYGETITPQGSMSQRGLILNVLAAGSRDLATIPIGAGELLLTKGVAESLGGKTIGQRLGETMIHAGESLSEKMGAIAEDYEKAQTITRQLFPSMNAKGQIQDPREMQLAEHMIKNIKNPRVRARQLLYFRSTRQVTLDMIPTEYFDKDSGPALNLQNPQ